MRMNQRHHHLVICLLASLGLYACGDSKPKNTAPATRSNPVAQSNEEKPKVRDLFNIKTKALEYSYNPIGKRDPFKESSGSSQIVQLDRGGPLTQFDIDQIKLVAVIWGISDPRGMVVLPDGKSYIVKRNTPVGRHYGKIARVTPTSVIVEEEFRGPLGDLQIKESKLLLHTETEAANNYSDEESTSLNVKK